MSKIWLYFVFLFVPLLGFGQNKTPFFSNPDSIKACYQSQTFNKQGYLNGREYKPYYNSQVASPFLESVLGFGEIYMDGVCYDGLLMAYDIYKDELVVMPSEYVSQNLFISINKSLIDSFNIKYGAMLYKLHKLSFKNDKLKDGFYEIPYIGKNTLLTRYYANEYTKDGQELYRHNKENFIIQLEDIYKINNKKAFIRVFPGHKAEIIRKFRSYGLPFKKLTNKQLAELLKFAETL